MHHFYMNSKSWKIYSSSNFQVYELEKVCLQTDKTIESVKKYATFFTVKLQIVGMRNFQYTLQTYKRTFTSGFSICTTIHLIWDFH